MKKILIMAVALSAFGFTATTSAMARDAREPARHEDRGHDRDRHDNDRHDHDKRDHDKGDR